MFKDGDDLRQDQLVLQMIGLMDRLFKLVNLDLNLTLYRVLPTSKEQGLMEFVESMPISKVLKEYKDIR
jgi:phosphatidylinositol 3-kinase